jgi:glycosyltransferase involved in cell wall biosynthesis
MSEVTVGIYMPALNAERYIRESIKSIQNQSFTKWFLAVIDDASDDNTYDKIQKIDDKRITHKIRNENRSGLIGKLKNQAINLLPETKYICHVGSDDLIPPNCLEVFVDFMESNPTFGAACGTFEAFNDAGKKWTFPHVTGDKGFNSGRLLRYMCLYPHRFYKRDAVMNVGGYSDTLSSAVDYDLALKLDETTIIGRIENVVTYYYRQHPEQVSRKERAQQDANAKKALQDALDRRGISKSVINNSPPFVIEEISPTHFTWSL